VRRGVIHWVTGQEKVLRVYQCAIGAQRRGEGIGRERGEMSLGGEGSRRVRRVATAKVEGENHMGQIKREAKLYAEMGNGPKKEGREKVDRPLVCPASRR